MTYEFSARDNQAPERPHLLSGWALAGFAVLVLIPLAMMFPKQELLRQASQQRLGDPLTISYLTNLLRAEPNNLELRLMLAEHKVYLGEIDDVAGLIQPALDSKDPAWQARGLLIRYKFLISQLRHTEKDSPQYAILLEQSMAAFRRLSVMTWPLPTLVYLAGQADQLHEHGISMLLYGAIDDAAVSVSVRWIADAAARAIARGEHELGAHLYFLARHKEYSRSGQRTYLLAGVHALMAAGLYEQAMRSIDLHLGNLEDDDETLYSLAQAARAANDQERAVRFAKRLLHISRLGDKEGWTRQLGLSWLGIANAEAETLPESTGEKIRTYDPNKYQLAYDVFIANSKFGEAFRVAEAAVQQAPNERIWHKRLAQLAEWTGRPEIALREWRWLLGHNGGKEALLAVMRLAPALNDYDALLDAWKQTAVQQKLTDSQLENMSSLFEQTGRQREGIRYFEGRYAADHRIVQLELAARMSERNNDRDHVIALYSRLLKEYGIRPAWVMKIADQYLQQGKFRKAYDLLQLHRNQVDKQEAAYWKLLADLAWQLQLDEDARKSYSSLQQSNNLAREGFGRLIYLLDDKQLDEKAALAELAYRRYADRDMLMRALEIHAAKQDRLAQKRLFRLVATRKDVDLSDMPRFYQLRAEYLQASGDFAAARKDYRHAVAISPDDPASINGVLWSLIDGQDEAALRDMVAQLTASGEQDNPAYWGVLAAAYQTLGQPSRALAYYTRQLKQGNQDFLWLVNYADALEQAGRGDMAARVRRHAWRQLRARYSGKPQTLPFSPDMLAAARLSMQGHPGDPALALVRSVLRQDRLVEQNAVEDAATRDLVLGWAISTEQSANAKAWLWQRYGQSFKRPLWADAPVALAENDRERLDRMLTLHSDGLSPPVRHDAARALGQNDYAESIAFDELAADPGSVVAHRHLVEDALAVASFIEAGVHSSNIASLHQHRLSTRLDMPMGRDMRVAVEYVRTRQSDDVTPELSSVPSLATVAGLALKNHGPQGDSEIALRRRNEFARTTEIQLKHATSVGHRISLQFGADYHSNADESIELLEFGMRNRVSAALSYNISERNSLHLEPGWARYYTQKGDSLGSGRSLSWEVQHQFHMEYPDWRARLIGMRTHFSPSAGAPLDLPPASRLYGACVGAGEGRRHAWGRAWLPYLDYCSTRNDVSGQGYNAELGLAGPVIGVDRLSLSYGQERGGVNLAYGLSREFNLNYRYYFD